MDGWMIYVDANYWIYWFDKRLPEHGYVLKSMGSAIRKGIVINYVTLMEIAHYLRHLDETEFKDRLETIRSLSTLTLIDLDASIVDLALKLLVKHASQGIGGRDSIILATMKTNKVNRILTHDGAFRKVKGVKVIDPIPTNQ